MLYIVPKENGDEHSDAVRSRVAMKRKECNEIHTELLYIQTQHETEQLPEVRRSDWNLQDVKKTNSNSKLSMFLFKLNLQN